MRFKRSDRPDTARRRLGASLELLEGRQMLSTTYGSLYHSQELPPRLVQHGRPNSAIQHPIGNAGPRQLSFLDNDGKVITGKDRQGDEYYLTLHGPGTIIVTDATPNDGSLDDDIDTIQLVGTDPNRSYLTGTTITTARTPSAGNFFSGFTTINTTDGIGEIYFNKLYAENGIKSIVLNGFTLTRTVDPPTGQANNSNTGIILQQGTGLLEFHDIRAPIDLSTGDGPINIQIGNPNTPLKVKPIIRLDRIFNTVFQSGSTTIPTDPQLVPTVNFVVNGELHSFEVVSSTAEPIDAAFQYLFPTVGTTGRTAVRANAIENLQSKGTVRNFTAARGEVPFQNGLSGLKRLGRADFGGNVDALGIDASSGNVGHLTFRRGVGSPIGASRSAAFFGTPAADVGYPGNGLYGGLITARKIRSIEAAPSGVELQTAQDPDYIQELRTGSTRYYARPGRALINTAIVSATSIGGTKIVGALEQSEISAGYHYPSYVAGLEPVRARSHIRPLSVRGDLIDSNVTSTVRAVDRVYNNGNDLRGRGKIVGDGISNLIVTNTNDVLGNRGAGYFARRKAGILPPPTLTRRVDSVLIR